MSEVRLTADSGGGTVELKGPASTPSNGARTILLPNGPGMVTQVVQTALPETIFDENIDSKLKTHTLESYRKKNNQQQQQQDHMQGNCQQQ